MLYSRDLAGNETYNNPTMHLIDYLASQGVVMREDPFIPKEMEISETEEKTNNMTGLNVQPNINNKLEIVEM